MATIEPPLADGADPRASTASTPAHSLDLPSLVPLSHEHPLLSSASFDVDAFLLSRIHIPLDELRGELREYLSVLREELVQLINDDYEEFISLGTGLRGEGSRLKRLQSPLGTLRGQVEGVRDVLKEHQEAMQAQLDSRAALREEKALLDLLQRLFETLDRAEALGSATGGTRSPGAGLADEDRAKAAARLAGEYSQLVYLRDKARSEQCLLADTASPRIDALRTRLSADLAAILKIAMASRDEPRMRQALRTYDAIEGWTEAEAVVRRDVHDFCLKTITAAALITPPSPAAPETPATPLTRGASAQGGNPNRIQTSSNLAQLYNRVLAQVEAYAPLIDIAHKVSPEFDFFARVLWPEIAKAVMDNLGHVIFAAGRPDELHKHYTTTHRFLTLLESHAPTTDAVLAMRDSTVYATFERRWQLPVYFQLRWKEIVSKFEASLASTSTTPPAGSGFALAQSAATWEAFRQCWAPEIYLPELSHRFWRLSLQIVARYTAWLSAALGTFAADDEGQDDASLRFSASAITDVDAIRGRIADLAVLSQLGEDLPLSLSSDAYASRIVGILKRRCAEPLKLVKSVAAQLRAAPARGATTPSASYFVPTLLKPLHTFFDARPSLASAYRAEWSRRVVEHVLTQYASVLASARKTEDMLRRHRRRGGGGFSLFGSGGSGTPEPADEAARFRAQMRADVDALAADARSLDVDVGPIGAWKELEDVVERPAA